MNHHSFKEIKTLKTIADNNLGVKQGKKNHDGGRHGLKVDYH
jgi:hypothetical protein